VLIEQAREGEAAQRRLAAQRADAEAQAKESLERQLYFNHIALAERGFSANDMGRAAQLLQECPPRLRDWEWRYLNHRRFENALSLTGHRGFVFSVVFSPDDRRLATSSLDGTVKLWDAATGQELRTLRPTLLPLPVVRVAFSHDGRQIAAAIASVL